MARHRLTGRQLNDGDDQAGEAASSPGDHSTENSEKYHIGLRKGGGLALGVGLEGVHIACERAFAAVAEVGREPATGGKRVQRQILHKLINSWVWTLNGMRGNCRHVGKSDVPGLGHSPSTTIIIPHQRRL